MPLGLRDDQVHSVARPPPGGRDAPFELRPLVLVTRRSGASSSAGGRSTSPWTPTVLQCTMRRTPLEAPASTRCQRRPSRWSRRTRPCGPQPAGMSPRCYTRCRRRRGRAPVPPVGQVAEQSSMPRRRVPRSAGPRLGRARAPRTQVLEVARQVAAGETPVAPCD